MSGASECCLAYRKISVDVNLRKSAIQRRAGWDDVRTEKCHRGPTGTEKTRDVGREDMRLGERVEGRRQEN